MFEKSSKKNDLQNAFSRAFDENNLNAIKELFQGEETPDINQDIVSGPPIVLAAMKKNWSMLELLYNLNADLDVKLINNNWHLIHECVKNAPPEVTSTLIEYCDLNVQTENGKTPLMVALREKNENVAKELIETEKLDLALVDNEDNNAAHYAAKNNMNAIFMLLIKKGVPLQKKNKQGLHPADLIDDQIFRDSLSKIPKDKDVVEKPVTSPKMETVTESEISSVALPKTEEKKLTGLSSIKRQR